MIGVTVVWLHRRGITPPSFIAWSLGIWVVIDAALSGPGVGQAVIILVATALLLAGARRAKHRMGDGAGVGLAAESAGRARAR